MYGSLINYNSKKRSGFKSTFTDKTWIFQTCWTITKSNPTKLNETNFYLLDTFENPEDGIMLRFTDKEMNVVEEAVSSEDMGYATGLVQLKLDFRRSTTILFFNSVPSPDPLAQQNQLDIWSSTEMQNWWERVELSHKYARSIEILEWNDDNSMVVIGNRVYGSSTTGDFRVGLDVLILTKMAKK